MPVPIRKIAHGQGDLHVKKYTKILSFWQQTRLQELACKAVDMIDDPVLKAEMDRIQDAVYGIGVDSDTRLGALLEALEWSPPPTILRAFHLFWSDCDATWGYRDDLLDIFRFVDSEEDKHDYMEPDAIDFLNTLPDPAQIFRGCSSEHINGLAWTTERAVAEGFARGHRGIGVPDAVVVSAHIPKEAIFFVCLDRDEAEVVIDFARLVDLNVRPFMEEAS